MDSQKLKDAKLVIDNVKKQLKADTAYRDRTLSSVLQAIRDIYNHKISGLKFEDIYRNASDLVLHKYGKDLYNGVVKTFISLLEARRASLEAYDGDLFLEELQRTWAYHNTSVKTIGRILAYMDRFFIPDHGKTPFHELGLELWRDYFTTSKFLPRLRNLLLEIIERERNDEIINRGLMKNLIRMLMDLGSYQEVFEKPFLEMSTDFYNSEAQHPIECCDCGDYLRKAEIRLNEESERVLHYLAAETKEKIITVVCTEMISKHIQRLVHMENSGLVSMLVDDKYDDLSRMHRFFLRVPELLPTIRNVMASHVLDTGKQLVNDPEISSNPIVFVQRLIDMKIKHEKIIRSSFGNDESIKDAIYPSFQNFIYLNKRTPEFLSLYLDDKIRKGLKGVIREEDVETVLDKALIIFQHLVQRDIFEKYYMWHLTNRLLWEKSAPNELERSLMLKLKSLCTIQFKKKIEVMFMDMSISKDIYATQTREMGEPMLEVQVLQAGSWPIKLNPPCRLPSEIDIVCEKFQNDYLETHTRRNLKWQTNLGRAYIKATFGEGRMHELNVSTYQMCVLMLFNSCNQLSYMEIQRATEIPIPDLNRCLMSLIRVNGNGMLLKEPKGKDISKEDAFYFNERFTSKFFKVRIGTTAAQVESEPEHQETLKRVKKDRKYQIDAAIVRIMKWRKELDHTNLVAELTKQLQFHFLPSPSVVKEQIESLIEKEFLERDKEDPNIYRYIA